MQERELLMACVVGTYTMLLVLYIFAFIARSELSANFLVHSRELSRVERVGLVIVGMGSGLVFAALIGELRTMHNSLLAAMVVGGVFGVIVSRVLVGRPRFAQAKSR